MAWLGVVAVIGLVVCGIDATYNVLRVRKERRSMPPGSPLPEYWTHRRLAYLVGAVVSVVVAGIAGLSIVFGTAGHGAKLVVAPTTTAPSATTTTLVPASTIAPGFGVPRPASQVHVDVLNGSGLSAAGASRAAALSRTGYKIVNTGTTTPQPSTVVECRLGFEADAVALARVVGPGTLIAGYPNADPPGAKNADCVLLLGPLPGTATTLP
ncbi:MAG TPA: LytR C-terminal domain-containing protein [Acidimicrobiia bacterium]|nr:LytR C-terminal domain-containing protein [Acidimicrobiia bacterium]